MALSKIDAANFLTGTIPSTNVANASLSSVTALPAGVGGKVLQVIQATSTSATDSSNESFVATNLTASITPTSSSNKILIIASGCYDLNGNARQADFAVYRNSSNISGGSGVSFSRPYSTNSRAISTVSINQLDTPNTTSSTSYTIRIRATSAGAVEFISQGTEAYIQLIEISA